MEAGELKSKLARCGTGPFRKTSFSIGHHGAVTASRTYPGAYRATARMDRRYDE
jgi:glycerophosphoryl diester phosphodiesterase